MPPQEKNSDLEHEREQARQFLHDTLNEVGAKIESAETGLRPDHMIESHAVGSALLAGALGFIFGSISKSKTAGPIIIAALVGFAISKRSPEKTAVTHDSSEE
jgi:hypothetical protein